VTRGAGLGGEGLLIESCAVSRRGSEGRIRRVFVRSVSVALAPILVVLTAGAALADVQVTPFYSDTPGPPGCSLTSPASSCGQWTYWMSIGAVIVGILVIGAVVLAYLRVAPRFAQEEPAMAGARAGGAGPARPAPATTISPPPAPTARQPAAVEPVSPAVGTGAGDLVVGSGMPAAGEAPAAPTAPAAAPAPAAATAVAPPRPPAERPAPVDPDEATFDRVLAEQLAKGTDRRVAEGRAKAAALKAAREKAAEG